MNGLERLWVFSMRHTLSPYFDRFRGWLRLRDGLHTAQRMLLPTSIATLAILFVLRVFPIEQRNVVWIPAVLWLAGCILYSILQPMPDQKIAWQIDYELGLKQRLSTSLTLIIDKDKPQYSSFDPALVNKVHQDALGHAKGIQVRSDLPIRIKPRPLQLAGLFMIACLILMVLPNPMDSVLAQRKEAAQETQRQAEQIEKTRDEILKNDQLSPEDREELLRKLTELAEQLRSNRGDREQALADLSRLEEMLKERLDPSNLQRQTALNAIAAQLQSLSENPGRQDGDLEAAAQALQQLAQQAETLSPKEREALANQLSQMAANAAQSGDSSLAQSMAQMAQAIQAGDQQAAQSAAQQAGQALRQAQSDIANQNATSQALSQIQDSRRAIAGQTAQGSSGQNGQASQANQSQGQGQGQGQGQPGGGGGATSNTLPSASRTGKAGAPQGQGQNTGITDQTGQVYIPFEKLPGKGSENLFISGQDSGQGETEVNEKPNPLGGASNPALVPYTAVYQEYLETANLTMEQSYIPPELKDYIRQYFSSLEP